MRNTKLEKGITLIALIITIIILLILAVVTIDSIQDNDIITYAQKASTEYEQKKTEEEGILSGYETFIEENIGEGIKVEPIVHNGKIPEGGTYKRKLESGSEQVYNGGDSFPETVIEGDIYIYGDYEYSYNCLYAAGNEGDGWYRTEDMDDKTGVTEGWGVRVLDRTKSEYSPAITTINGKNVTGMFCTYTVCGSLKKAPNIPDTVTYMSYAFEGCTLLENVLNMPKSLVVMNDVFRDCISLKSVGKLSENVVDMSYAFYGCTNLLEIANIPNSVTNMNSSFKGCKNLKNVPNIPNGVKEMNDTFYECESLINVKTIPASVKEMNSTFYRCKSLTGNIEINANPNRTSNCFSGTEKEIVLTGSTDNTKKQELAATSTLGNVTWK